jgi:hypothetical protein
MIGVDPLAELGRTMAQRPGYKVLVEDYQRGLACLVRLQMHLAGSYVLDRAIQGILLYWLAA